ncbi:MAG: invasion associated locus B family protein [Rhizomicrobium sp.]|jgi:invasion protein IalB
MWRHTVLAVVAMVGFGTQVYAASPPQPAKPATAIDNTAQSGSLIEKTQTFGSWSVQCYRSPGSVCDISQVAFARQQDLRMLGISIAYVPDRKLYTARIVVPLLVSFAKGMTIEIGSYRLADLKYRRCERDGCYVEGVLPQEMIDAMAKSNIPKGAIEIASVNGQKITLPIVLDGFSGSLSQMKQWDEEKAAPAAAKPPPAPR